MQSGDETLPLDSTLRSEIEQRYSDGAQVRVLGLATKTEQGHSQPFLQNDENQLTFAVFLDPPKADVKQVIVDLAQRGVQLKIITGDNQKRARHVAEAVGLSLQGVLHLVPVDGLHEEALAPGRTHHAFRGSVDVSEGAHPACAEKDPGTWSARDGDAMTRRPCTPRTSALKRTM